MQDQNLSPLKAFFRNKWVLLTIAVDILIIIALITIAVVKSMKKSVLTINVVPVDAVVKVNGQTGYTNGSYRLFPGVYEIEISHPELATKTFSIDLAKHDVGTITTFLSDDDFSFYQLRANLGAFSVFLKSPQKIAIKPPIKTLPPSPSSLLSKKTTSSIPPRAFMESKNSMFNPL